MIKIFGEIRRITDEPFKTGPSYDVSREDNIPSSILCNWVVLNGSNGGDGGNGGEGGLCVQLWTVGVGTIAILQIDRCT